MDPNYAKAEFVTESEEEADSQNAQDLHRCVAISLELTEKNQKAQKRRSDFQYHIIISKLYIFKNLREKTMEALEAQFTPQVSEGDQSRRH